MSCKENKAAPSPTSPTYFDFLDFGLVELPLRERLLKVSIIDNHK